MRDIFSETIFKIAIAVVAVMIAAPALAQEAITPQSTNASNAELDKRIKYIAQRLDASKTHGQIWHYGWLTVNTANTAVSGYYAATSSKTDNIVKNAVSAGTSTIGIASQYLDPLEARYGSDPFINMPEATRDDKIAKLQTAEKQLIRNAERSEERLGLVKHGGNLGLSLAAGLIVGLVGDGEDGVVTGATTFVGGLANIFSEPWEADDDLERYKAFIGQRTDTADLGFYVNALADGGAKAGVRITW
jgi:hypothetical protein